MKQYAVIHAVAGLFEGYSDTTCEFFPKRGFADKHIKKILDEKVDQALSQDQEPGTHSPRQRLVLSFQLGCKAWN